MREFDYPDVLDVVGRLETLARAVDIPAMVRLMKVTVPEFKSSGSRFEAIDRELAQEKQKN